MIKRAVSILSLALATFVAVFGRVEPWLAVSLLALLAAVGIVGFLARREPQGIAARMQSQSMGPRTDVDATTADLFRSSRTFGVAFVAFATLFGGLIWISANAATARMREIALVGGLVFVLPMTMCFAGAGYLLLRASLRHFAERFGRR